MERDELAEFLEWLAPVLLVAGVTVTIAAIGALYWLMQ